MLQRLSLIEPSLMAKKEAIESMLILLGTILFVSVYTFSLSTKQHNQPLPWDFAKFMDEVTKNGTFVYMHISTKSMRLSCVLRLLARLSYWVNPYFLKAFLNPLSSKNS